MKNDCNYCIITHAESNLKDEHIILESPMEPVEKSLELSAITSNTVHG